jgi:hypothetical protein
MGDQDPSLLNAAGAPPKSLEAKIKAWLETQGYPLEMRIAKMFRSASFTRVVESDYFESSEKVWREIDVSAQLGQAWKQEELRIFFDMFVICECKSSPRRKTPWVVFTTDAPHLDERARVHARSGTELGRSVLEQIVVDEKLRALPLFKSAQRYGYSVINPLTRRFSEEPEGQISDSKDPNTKPQKDSNYDTAWGVLMKMLDAARAKASIVSPVYAIARIVFPVIVVSGKLFESYLDDSGSVAVIERERLTMLWRNPAGDNLTTQVHFIAEHALASFVEDVTEAFQYISQHHQAVFFEQAKRLGYDEQGPPS